MITRKEIERLISDLKNYMYPNYFDNKQISKSYIKKELNTIFKKTNIQDYPEDDFLNELENIKKELEKAGLDTRKYSVHKLRHTAATLMYRYGNVDIRALQVLLGHDSISTTQIYTHVDDQQVRNAVEDNPLADLESEYEKQRKFEI